jgi:hypothetical protein
MISGAGVIKNNKREDDFIRTVDMADYEWLNSDLQMPYLISLYTKIVQGVPLNKLNLCTIENYIIVNLEDMNKVIDVKEAFESILSMTVDDIRQMIENAITVGADRETWLKLMILLSYGVVELEPMDKIYLDIDLYIDEKLSENEQMTLKHAAWSHLAKLFESEVAKFIDKQRIRYFITPSHNLRIVINLSGMFDFEKVNEEIDNLYADEIRYGNFLDSFYIKFNAEKSIETTKVYRRIDTINYHINYMGKYWYNNDYYELLNYIALISKIKRILKDILSTKFEIPVTDPERYENKIIVSFDYTDNLKGMFFVEDIMQPRKEYKVYKITEFDPDTIDLSHHTFIKPKKVLLKHLYIEKAFEDVYNIRMTLMVRAVDGYTNKMLKMNPVKFTNFLPTFRDSEEHFIRLLTERFTPAELKKALQKFNSII